MANTPCPDFELAPLTKWSPKILPEKGKDPPGALSLALSIAFNDFKDIQWVNHQLRKCRPERAISAERGQWMGMVQFINRRLAALMFELLEALARAGQEGVLDGEEWREALDAMPEGHREYWQLVIDAALAKEDADATGLRTALMLVRHNAANHYCQDKALLDAYRQHFYEQAPNPANSDAFASLGSRLENTRFYFADAAATAFFNKQFPPTPGAAGGAPFELFDGLQLVLNQGLRSFLEAFWSRRQAKLVGSEAPP